MNKYSNDLVNQGVKEVKAIVKSIEDKEKEFKQKELQFTYKFYDFIEKHAINVAGCDSSCVNKCTNPSKYPIYKVGDCLEKCDCSGGAIQVTESAFPAEKMALYAGEDLKAYSFFQEKYPY